MAVVPQDRFHCTCTNNKYSLAVHELLLRGCSVNRIISHTQRTLQNIELYTSMCKHVTNMVLPIFSSFINQVSMTKPFTTYFGDI